MKRALFYINSQLPFWICSNLQVSSSKGKDCSSNMYFRCTKGRNVVSSTEENKGCSTSRGRFNLRQANTQINCKASCSRVPIWCADVT